VLLINKTKICKKILNPIFVINYASIILRKEKTIKNTYMHYLNAVAVFLHIF